MPSSPLVEADLLARLHGRDPDALTSVVREHTKPLFRAARGMGLAEDAAEDLVQDVLATFLSTLDRFEGRSQVGTWLFGILHKKIFEYRRGHARDERNDSIDDVFESRFDTQGNWTRPPEDLDRLLESKEAGVLIEGCLEHLPGSQRAAFTLREIQDLDTPEICEILGISVSNFGVLMHRARTHLRECLEAHGVTSAAGH